MLPLLPSIACCQIPDALSLNHSIRSHQKMGWNFESQGLGRLKVDHQLELRWLLDGQVCWLYALEDFINITGCSSKDIRLIRSVGYESTGFYKFTPTIDRR